MRCTKERDSPTSSSGPLHLPCRLSVGERKGECRISDDDTTIIVDKKGAKNAPYGDFVEEIAAGIAGGKDCRYGCVDVEFTVQRQGTDSSSRIQVPSSSFPSLLLTGKTALGTLQKVIFVQCCPDEAPVRKRMLYASSVRGLKSSLGLESLMQVPPSSLPSSSLI